MGKTLSTGFINDTVNGIKINTGIQCNAGNYTAMNNRNVAYIVMHYTGNSKDTAKANANYFTGTGRNASAHFFVDDKEIYQSVAIKNKAWHCGTSGTYYHNECRNTCSIGIEMCCTAGNYKISEKTKENAAQLCAHLCRITGITADGVEKYVVRHYDVTHKNCPAQMAGSGNAEWAAFKNRVKSILGGGSTTTNTGKANAGKATLPTAPFTVKILVSDLNIRSNPSMGNNVVGQTGKGVFTITETKNGFGKLKSGTGWIYLLNSEYCTVLGQVVGSTSKSSSSYTVKITADVLNVRKGPGTNYGVSTQVKKGQVYTVVAEEKNGSTTWGKLKSGAGYISLDYTVRV